MKRNTLRQFNAKFIAIATFTLGSLALSSQAAYAEMAFPIPQAPKLEAAAYILIDAKSGEVLAEYRADERRDPASLTKMMTSYVVGEAIKNQRISDQDIVTVSKQAWAMGNPALKGSSVMFLKPGDKVSVADLNRGMIIQSGNDACIALAEHVAGSQDAFVNLMNDYVKQLKLTNTHFETVHGLDAKGQYTSARDMAYLGRALIRDLPKEYAIYNQKEFTYNNIRQPNRNGLLWDTSLQVDGIKTGHTKAAGYNLVASAVEGNTRLVSAVLGGYTFKGREAESKKLLTWGFRFFETAHPLKANTVVAQPRLWFGSKDTIKIGNLNDIYLSVPKGESNKLSIRYKLDNSSLSAPITAGVKVGSMQFILNDKVLAEKPLYTLEQVDQAGLFGRVWDFILFKLQQWF